MLELFGIIGGALTPFIKEGFNIWRMKLDYQHEQKMYDLQLQRLEKEHEYRVEEANLRADIKESANIYKLQTRPVGTGFMENLRASVRPVTTYAFLLFYFCVKYATFIILTDNPGNLPWQNLGTAEALLQLWTPEERVIFATIIGFWYGSRNIEKARSYYSSVYESQGKK